MRKGNTLKENKHCAYYQDIVSNFDKPNLLCWVRYPKTISYNYYSVCNFSANIEENFIRWEIRVTLAETL